MWYCDCCFFLILCVFEKTSVNRRLTPNVARLKWKGSINFLFYNYLRVITLTDIDLFALRNASKRISDLRNEHSIVKQLFAFTLTIHTQSIAILYILYVNDCMEVSCHIPYTFHHFTPYTFHTCHINLYQSHSKMKYTKYKFFYTLFFYILYLLVARYTRKNTARTNIINSGQRRCVLCFFMPNLHGINVSRSLAETCLYNMKNFPDR